MPTACRLLLSLAFAGALALGACATEQREVSFAADVQPLFAERCGRCHVPGQAGHEASGLGLDSYEALMKGTKYGQVVIPGDPLSSVLNMLIEGRADPSIAMPHGEAPLSPEEQQLVRRWVEQGAQNN